jgi:hypothetical protein
VWCWLAGFLGVITLLAAVMPRAVQAQEEAQAAQRPAVSIAILTSSRSDVCYDPGDIAAITRLTRLEQERINQRGGVAGRRVELRFLDDARDQQRTLANVRNALADPQTLAIVGLSASNRAKAVFDALGNDIRTSGIPFITDISLSSMFQDLPNVFTTRSSQDDERLPVMASFIRHMRFTRTAFVGVRDFVFSAALGEGLTRELGAGLVSSQWLGSREGQPSPDEVVAVVSAIQDTQPDLVMLGVGTSRSVPLINALKAAGSAPALFLLGRIEALPAEVVNSYPNAIYQLTWDRLPEAYNDEMRKLIASGSREDWVFEGRKIPEAPGWKSGECKERPADAVADPLESANLRAIGIGTQFADMVGLIATAAGRAQPQSDVDTLRRRVVKKLKTSYAAGKGVYKGSFENWSFDPSSRAAVRTPFVVILPAGLGRTQLAPVQFARLRGGTLRQIETLYVDIDLIRLHRVDDNEKTFFAEFYLSMHHSETSSLDDIDFTNAYIDPKTNGRQLSVEVLHGGGRSDSYPEGMKIYKISGRFTYEPQLARYPFDTQRFAIDLQPKRGDRPFIIQPPPLELRDRQVTTDGWDPELQYVGYGEDFVPVVDAYTHEPNVVPFYRASFVWLMKRQTTDYFLRVIVPLIFIMVVAYLSIFISQAHFEAIVTIQVTALLSAVALYLSLPKLDSDTATLSDRIFVFDYMVVSLMIVISIMRVNKSIAMRPWLKNTLGFMHIVLLPAVVAAMMYYVHTLSAPQY